MGAGISLMLFGVVAMLGAFFVSTQKKDLFVIGAALAGFGYLFAGSDVRKAIRARRLLREGRRVDAEFISATLNLNLSVGDVHPYRMKLRWRDPHTHLIRNFESVDIWFDPTTFAQGRSIDVYIDDSDPSQYHVDTSFLPENPVKH